MRRIFVGSSNEHKEQAKYVSDLINKVKEAESILWWDVFEPGYVALEALDKMLGECCGAVFIATPDDDAHIRGRAVKTPRANIMLEFGLVAGRLGFPNVALCHYGCVEFPSDLQGLTMIPMDAPLDMGADAAAQFRLMADEKVSKWVSRLIGTAERIARTEIVHGYAGRWRFNVYLSRWRGLDLKSPSFAVVNGEFDLLVGLNGQYGSGFAHGRLTFKVGDPPPSDRQPYQGEFRVCHEITNVLCSEDGALSLTSTVFALHLMTASSEPPPELAGLKEPPEPWPFDWELRPTGEPCTLEGAIRTDARGVMTEGIANAVKQSEGS